MNKYEIKKALECCTTMTRDGVGMCNECPYNKRDKDGYILCGNQNLHKDALNLIIEQEQEIEKLKAENEKRLTCDFVKTAQKQAKIDVLNELKTRHDYAIKNAGYPWDISQQIDELIEEIKNDIFRRTI